MANTRELKEEDMRKSISLWRIFSLAASLVALGCGGNTESAPSRERPAPPTAPADSADGTTETPPPSPADQPRHEPEQLPPSIETDACPDEKQVLRHSACVDREWPSSPPGKCLVDGVAFHYGETFMASDLCNSCGCTKRGPGPCTMVGCRRVIERPERRPCPAGWQKRGDICVGVKNPRFATPSKATCTVHGETLKSGETWVADDYCNTCRCNERGTPECTTRTCLFQLNRVPLK
jgi:hypothetical protein